MRLSLVQINTTHMNQNALCAKQQHLLRTMLCSGLFREKILVDIGVKEKFMVMIHASIQV